MTTEDEEEQLDGNRFVGCESWLIILLNESPDLLAAQFIACEFSEPHIGRCLLACTHTLHSLSRCAYVELTRRTAARTRAHQRRRDGRGRRRATTIRPSCLDVNTARRTTHRRAGCRHDRAEQGRRREDCWCAGCAGCGGVRKSPREVGDAASGCCRRR